MTTEKREEAKIIEKEKCKVKERKGNLSERGDAVKGRGFAIYCYNILLEDNE